MCTHVLASIIHGIIIAIIISMVCNHYTHVKYASLFFPKKCGGKVHIKHDKIRSWVREHPKLQRLGGVREALFGPQVMAEMLEQLGNEQGPRLLLPSGFTHLSLWLPLLSPSRRMSSSHHATFPTATKQEDRRQGKGEALSLWTCVRTPVACFLLAKT